MKIADDKHCTCKHMSKYKVVYQMKKLQNVSKFENIFILWLENNLKAHQRRRREVVRCAKSRDRIRQ